MILKVDVLNLRNKATNDGCGIGQYFAQAMLKRYEASYLFFGDS